MISLGIEIGLAAWLLYLTTGMALDALARRQARRHARRRGGYLQ